MLRQSRPFRARASPRACLQCMVAKPPISTIVKGTRQGASVERQEAAHWPLALALVVVGGGGGASWPQRVCVATSSPPQQQQSRRPTTALAAAGSGGGSGDSGSGSGRSDSADAEAKRQGQEPQREQEETAQSPQQQQTKSSSPSSSSSSSPPAEHDGPAVRAALAMLRFYRTGISPLMQSTCRFVPTCSQYSIDSYRAHGAWRGTVLTAWRLLRCNPWGGEGYDPTAWPPVGLAPVFALPFSEHVAVIGGAALVVRLGHALLFE